MKNLTFLGGHVDHNLIGLKMSRLNEFLEHNQDLLTEEIRLLFFLKEKPEQKVCVIDGLASTDCGAGITCKYAMKNNIADPVEDSCKYWIPIKSASEETKEEILSNVLSRKRRRAA